MKLPSLICSLLLTTALACGDSDIDGGGENEVITSIIVTFTPTAGGTATTVELDDPDGDGGDPPTIDPLDLAAGAYTMTVRFENRLESPPEDITAEVGDESDEHQIFVTGSAVSGPATSNTGTALAHTYGDQDSGGLPIGLENDIVATAGTGELTITLRHLPPVGDSPVKTADLASTVAASGFAAIGGSTDAQATFPTTVQ